MTKKVLKKTSTQFFSIPIALAIFINICLLYTIIYQGGKIYANHVNDVATVFKKQTTYDEVLFGIINSVSDKTRDNTSAIRNHIETINQHADIINDNIAVLTNHAEVQNAQTAIINQHSKTIVNQLKRLKRLESIVNNLQKKLGYNKNRPMPETEI